MEMPFYVLVWIRCVLSNVALPRLTRLWVYAMSAKLPLAMTDCQTKHLQLLSSIYEDSELGNAIDGQVEPRTQLRLHYVNSDSSGGCMPPRRVEFRPLEPCKM